MMCNCVDCPLSLRNCVCREHTLLQRRGVSTHCSTLQHTATHCNTLQHTATHCSTLQHTTTHCSTLQHTATHCNTLQHTRNTLQHTATTKSLDRRPLFLFAIICLSACVLSFTHSCEDEEGAWWCSCSRHARLASASPCMRTGLGRARGQRKERQRPIGGGVGESEGKANKRDVERERASEK